jgi:hypothetical protein
MWIVTNDIQAAVIAGDLEISVIRSQPSVIYSDDIHAAISQGQSSWCLLSPIASITIHPDLHGATFLER